jgi:hypothetical protein
MIYQVKVEISERGSLLATEELQIDSLVDRRELALNQYRDANPLYENPRIVSVYESSQYTTSYTIADTHEYVDRETGDILEDKVRQIVTLTVNERLTLD